MKTTVLTAIAISAAAPALAAPEMSVWNNARSPSLPHQYIESVPVARLTWHNSAAETYAPEALYLRLYPSIGAQLVGDKAAVTNIQPSISSKNSPFLQNPPRGNLSTSYLQEFAYIDVYSNTGEYDNIIRQPTIQMSFSMPRFVHGLGGGYLPLQLGFGPFAAGGW